MPYTIRITQSLEEEEQQLLFKWDDDVFEVTNYNIQWQQKEWHIKVYADEHLVSHVGLLKHTVMVGEHSNQHAVTVAGVGSVVTIPAAQKQGYARIALAEAARFMCEELEVEFGLLLCRPELVAFYARVGWQQVQAPIIANQPKGKIFVPMSVMVLPCKDYVWPAGMVDLQNLPW